MIVSLARANLLHDWRRHATAIVVLVLAGLLMTIQLGFVAGWVEAYGEMQRQMRPDLIVQFDAGGASFRGRGRFSRFFSRGGVEPRHEGYVWMHPEVVQVEGFNDFAPRSGVFKDDGSFENVEIRVVDPRPGSLTWPKGFPDSLREIIATPGMVVATRATRRNLGLELGDTLVLQGKEAIIGGIVNGLASPFGERVFASPQTMRMLTEQSMPQPSMFLVQIEHPERVDRVIAEMNAMLAPRQLKASRVEDVARSMGMKEIFEGPGMILLGSAAFALFVGCGIASQTLRGAFLAQIREFGSLRALGVRRKHLAWIAMEQAWWTGLVSVPIAAGIAYLIRAFARMFDVTIALPANLMVSSSILLIVVALIAGVISLSVVSKAQPAELLR